MANDKGHGYSASEGDVIAKVAVGVLNSLYGKNPVQKEQPLTAGAFAAYFDEEAQLHQPCATPVQLTTAEQGGFAAKNRNKAAQASGVEATR